MEIYAFTCVDAWKKFMCGINVIVKKNPFDWFTFKGHIHDIKKCPQKNILAAESQSFQLLHLFQIIKEIWKEGNNIETWLESKILMKQA